MGDVITDDGKNNENIASRKTKGFGISGDIQAMLNEIPFGPYKIKAGILSDIAPTILNFSLYIK